MNGSTSPLPQYAFTARTGTSLPLYTNTIPLQPHHIHILWTVCICLSDFCISMCPLFAFICPMTFYPQSFSSNIICSPVLFVTCCCPHALSHTDGLPLYCCDYSFIHPSITDAILTALFNNTDSVYQGACI
jgi:hypothetical protein